MLKKLRALIFGEVRDEVIYQREHTEVSIEFLEWHYKLKTKQL